MTITYAAASFHTAGDGHGGTLVTDLATYQNSTALVSPHAGA